MCREYHNARPNRRGWLLEQRQPIGGYRKWNWHRDRHSSRHRNNFIYYKWQRYMANAYCERKPAACHSSKRYTGYALCRGYRYIRRGGQWQQHLNFSMAWAGRFHFRIAKSYPVGDDRSNG